MFPPQFLSRLQRIIVFNPLDAAAMRGIVARACRRLADRWWQKREKRIEIAPEVVDALARAAHEENDRTDGSEGGRIVRKLVRDRIESQLQTAATAERGTYRQATRIFVSLVTPGSEDASRCETRISFSEAAPRSSALVTRRAPG